MSRITVAVPKPRDSKQRESFIPDSVLQSRDAPSSQMEINKQTEKQLMWNNGGPGVYVCDYRKYYIMEEDDWRLDCRL